MGYESYNVFTKKNEQVYSRNYNAREEVFKKYTGIPLENLPYAILIDASKPEEISHRMYARVRLNKLVFGDNADKLESAKYAWSFNDHFIKPSKVVLDTVPDVLVATEWFCVNRTWHLAMRVEDSEGSVEYMHIINDKVGAQGFEIENVSIPVAALKRCMGVEDAKRVITRYLEFQYS